MHRKIDRILEIVEFVPPLAILLIILLYAFMPCSVLTNQAHAQYPAGKSSENLEFELWLQKTYENMSIFHEIPQDIVYIYVNEHWNLDNKPQESRHEQALKRLGCAARTEFAGELPPVYKVQILMWIQQPGGVSTTSIAAESVIDTHSCAIHDFFPILSPKKETPL